MANTPDQYSRNRLAQVEVKLSPPSIVLDGPTLPGWADDRLRQAYALIDDVMDRLNSEDDVFQLLKTALEAVENADCELEKRA